MIILQGITVPEFYSKVESIIENKLEELFQKERKRDLTNTFLSRKEVCKMLQISPPTLSEWSKQGLIKSQKIGNRVIYRAEDVDTAVTVQYKFRRNL